MVSRNRWTIVGLILVPFTFILMIATLWALDFFEFSGSEASAKVIGTALTLGGSLVATMVTLIGLILRQSVEQRNADLREETENRLRLEAKRNESLHKEAEQRLKLEAAIRAVDLLGTSAGGNSSLLQRTGALFTLSRLGMIGLAIDLVRIMRVDDLIEASSTKSLLDIALRSNDPVVQESAAEFIRDHSDKLIEKDGIEWPDYITFEWPQDLTFLSRSYVLEGMMEGILSLPRNGWNRDNLNVCVVFLMIAFRAEKDLRLKEKIGLFLQKILTIYDRDRVIFLPNENLEIDAMLKQVASIEFKLADLSTQSIVNRLTSWLGDQSFVTQGNVEV